MFPLKKLLANCLLALPLLSAAQAADAPDEANFRVKPGIEVLRESGFEALKGKRVGLITNPTGVDNSLQATIDILNEAPEVKLVALFAPEHGVRGDITAGTTVSNTVDAATGVKVYSLYGTTKKPTAEMLANVDALVYDIQDNGCRSYTFISTMAMAMEQCAKLGKEFVVLDRPNPLGGNKIEGLCTDADDISFVGYLPIPYIYGLTPGELAQLIVGEKLLKTDKQLKLTVIPMEGWERDMLFDDTAMPWVLPSPHMPTLQTSLYYPATGILGELDYLSIGVGYTMPFRTFAAPWINAAKLAKKLNGMAIPGVAFRPIFYKPFYAFKKGENLQGVELYISDFEAAPLTLVQFYVMEALAELYPDHKALDIAPAARLAMFDKVVGSKAVRPTFFKNYKVADLLPLWNRDLDSFRKTKQKYHIY
jgi:uncharacterized protein YbbC (DUF1343 family)